MTEKPKKITLEELEALSIGEGLHETRTRGVCAAEAVAWLAGERHSDKPECLCPVIGSMLRRLNDRMPDDSARNEYLRPILSRLVGTRSTREVEIRRAYLAADFAVRVVAPIGLEAAARATKNDKLREHAERLRALAPFTDKASVHAAENVASEARSAASASAAAAAAAASASAAASAAAAAAAAYASAAAAAAAASASASSASAAAYAYAAAASAYDAYSAYASDASDAARAPVWRASADLLVRMAEINA